MPKISEAHWGGIVSRILAGRSTAVKEGGKYGIPASTIRSRVHEAKAKMKDSQRPDNAPDNAPTSPTPTTPNNAPSQTPLGTPAETTLPPQQPNAAAALPADAYQRAREAAGIPAGASTPTSASSPASVDEAARRADADDKELVLTTYGELKKTLVGVIAQKMGILPTDPLLAGATQISPLVKTVLEVNAGLIAPILRGKLVGWPAVVGVVVFDGVVTVMAIREVAIARGLVKTKKQKEEEAAAAAAPAAAA